MPQEGNATCPDEGEATIMQPPPSVHGNGLEAERCAQFASRVAAIAISRTEREISAAGGLLFLLWTPTRRPSGPCPSRRAMCDVIGLRLAGISPAWLNAPSLARSPGCSRSEGWGARAVSMGLRCARPCEGPRDELACGLGGAVMVLRASRGRLVGCLEGAQASCAGLVCAGISDSEAYMAW